MRLRWLALSLAALLGTSCVDAPSSALDADPRLCLTVLDVGQGDALLVSFPEGQHWLVDGGGSAGGSREVGRKKLLPALRRLGVVHLEKVLMTHAHADHFEGLFAIFDSLEVDELWLPERAGLKPRARALIQRALRSGVQLREAGRGAVLEAPSGPVQAQLLHPFVGWREELVDSDSELNDSSLVLRLALGEVSYLLTGDIEAAAERLLLARGVLQRSTVLKVPHHASKSSSTPAFVAAVDPLVAVAGIGADNRFGFPHASVSARYLGRGTPLLWTARHGAMRFCTNGLALSVERLQDRGPSVLFAQWDATDIAAWRGQHNAPPRPNRATHGLSNEPHRRKGKLTQSRNDSARRGKASTRRSKGSARRSKTSARRSRASATRAKTSTGRGKVNADGEGRRRGRSKARAGAKQDDAAWMSDKDWQRSRKRRKRLRAPWK